MQHWPTTGNVAIQTGSTYISDSMTDITTILTANLGFSIMVSSQEVSTTGYNVDWQLEVAIWSQKPKNSYTTGTTTDSIEIPTASPGFLITVSLNKVSSSDCDNDWQPKMAMWPPKPEIHISLELWQTDDNSNGKSRVFDNAQLEETEPRRLRQWPTTRNGNIDVFGANLTTVGSWSLSQSFG